MPGDILKEGACEAVCVCAPAMCRLTGWEVLIRMERVGSSRRAMMLSDAWGMQDAREGRCEDDELLGVRVEATERVKRPARNIVSAGLGWRRWKQ